MRQAIIIKNPKWQDFEKARAAFKSAELAHGEEVVLVISSNSKRRANKTKPTPKKSDK